MEAKIQFEAHGSRQTAINKDQASPLCEIPTKLLKYKVLDLLIFHESL